MTASDVPGVMPAIAFASPNEAGFSPVGPVSVRALSNPTNSTLSVSGTNDHESTRASLPSTATCTGASSAAESSTDAVNSALSRAPSVPTAASVKR